jgi:hypothetical protein
MDGQKHHYTEGVLYIQQSLNFISIKKKFVSIIKLIDTQIAFTT